MKIEWVVPACGDGHSVVATNVGPQDNPEPAMKKSAMDSCQTEAHLGHVVGPVTYTIINKYTYKTLQYGKVVEWGIQCGKPAAVVAKSKQSSEMC
jgi:hypothetical protein